MERKERLPWIKSMMLALTGVSFRLFLLIKSFEYFLDLSINLMFRNCIFYDFFQLYSICALIIYIFFLVVIYDYFLLLLLLFVLNLFETMFYVYHVFYIIVNHLWISVIEFNDKIKQVSDHRVYFKHL